MKFLCPEERSFSRKGLTFAKKHFDLDTGNLSRGKLKAVIDNYDGLLIRFNTKVDEELINLSSRLKYIISPTTGLDHIDIKLAEMKKIKLFHLRGETEFLSNVTATAELTIGLILSLLRNIPASFDSVKKNSWHTNSFIGTELIGKKICIIGMGRLGKRVAKIAQSFEMNVIGYDPYVLDSSSSLNLVKNLDEALKNADIVSIHIPLNEENKNFVNNDFFKKMKQGSVLINTSRGSIVEEDHLIEALKSKKISGAAIDVIQNEKLLLKGQTTNIVEYAKTRSNLIITPHIGGSTSDSIEKTDMFIINKFIHRKNLPKDGEV